MAGRGFARLEKSHRGLQEITEQLWHVVAALEHQDDLCAIESLLILRQHLDAKGTAKLFNLADLRAALDAEIAALHEAGVYERGPDN